MRTISTDMAASIRTESATLAHLWKLTRKDGTVLRITDHDRDIKVGGATFRSSIGFSASATVSSSINFGSQQCEIKMAMTDDGLREADVRGRLWAGAQAVYYVVDWTNPTSILPMFSGSFGRVTISDANMAKIEVFGIGNQTMSLAGELYSMTCRNSLGDKKCLINIESFRVNFTVAAVLDAATIVVSDLRGQADGYYAFGQLVWDTGLNEGTANEVQTSINATNEVGLFFPPASNILIGDTGHIYPGCDLLVTTCNTKFANVVNFNGEPYNIQPRIISAPASTGSAVGGTGGIQPINPAF